VLNGVGRLRDVLVDDDPLAQVCRDLPESACQEQPRNIGLHVASLSLTKVGEGLADTKLVLAWLLDAIGAPTWAMGLLVPVRESLAMLPQLLISVRIRQLPIRKHVYVSGCVVQGAAIIGIGGVAAACARSATRTCLPRPWTKADAARSAGLPQALPPRRPCCWRWRIRLAGCR
jgi:hypothetical protein